MGDGSDEKPKLKQLTSNDIRTTRHRDRRTFFRALGFGILGLAALPTAARANYDGDYRDAGPRTSDSDGSDSQGSQGQGGGGEGQHDEKSLADTDLPTTQDNKAEGSHDADYTHNDRKADSD
jgi:hypothetical protein